MRIATVAGLTGLALISLSACNRNSQSAAASSAASGAAPATASNTSGSGFQPGQMPHYREGLWEQRMAMDGRDQPMVSQSCLDKTVEQKMAAFGASIDRSKCSTYNVNHQLNGDWAISTVCDRGSGGTVSSSGTIHGDFNSAYHMEMDTKTTGAAIASMNHESKITIDGKWLGPCGPDMKPGDVMVNGMKVNVFNPSAGAGAQHPGG